MATAPEAVRPRPAVPGASTTARVAVHVSALATGLFAGLIWTFAVAIDRAEEHLDARQYAFWRQNLIHDLDRGILPVLVLTGLAPIVALVALRRHPRSAAFRWTAAAFAVYAVGVMAFTLLLNVPLNNEMLDWDAANPPADWAGTRDRWDLLNWIRTPVVIASFLGYLLAIAALHRVGDEPTRARR